MERKRIYKCKKLLERVKYSIYVSAFSFALSAIFVYWLFGFNLIIILITAIMPGILFFLFGKSKKKLKKWLKEIFDIISSVT